MSENITEAKKRIAFVNENSVLMVVEVPLTLFNYLNNNTSRIDITDYPNSSVVAPGDVYDPTTGNILAVDPIVYAYGDPATPLE
jgi:hypothetical protein